MIAVGYDTLCRRRELVALRVEEVSYLANGSAKVMVPRGKTDPFGDGRWAFLSSGGVAELKAWLDATGLTHGPIFRPVVNGALQERHLHPLVVARTLKLAAQRAGLGMEKVSRLSGHSMRVGAAQDLMAAGRSVVQIMTAGGWTSVNVVGRYVRDAEFNVWAD
jgi:integrase